MDDELRKRIIDVLGRTRLAFKNFDARELINLSDMTLHFAGIQQDPHSITIAVAVHTLAKIIQRRKYQESRLWKNCFNTILDDLKKAREALEKEDEKGYEAFMKNVLKSSGKIDKRLSKHIIEVIEAAKIKKGSEVYRQGISVGRAAELMGITPWELRDYIGHTKIADIDPLLTRSAKRRIREARRIFGLQ